MFERDAGALSFLLSVTTEMLETLVDEKCLVWEVYNDFNMLRLNFNKNRTKINETCLHVHTLSHQYQYFSEICILYIQKLRYRFYRKIRMCFKRY